jgi:hypothetical protein
MPYYAATGQLPTLAVTAGRAKLPFSCKGVTFENEERRGRHKVRKRHDNGSNNNEVKKRRKVIKEGQDKAQNYE